MSAAAVIPHRAAETRRKCFILQIKLQIRPKDGRFFLMTQADGGVPLKCWSEL